MTDVLIVHGAKRKEPTQVGVQLAEKIHNIR